MQPIMDEFQGLLPAMHPTLMMGEHKKSIEAATNMQEQMLCATNRTRPPPPSCQTCVSCQQRVKFTIRRFIAFWVGRSLGTRFANWFLRAFVSRRIFLGLCHHFIIQFLR